MQIAPNLDGSGDRTSSTVFESDEAFVAALQSKLGSALLVVADARPDGYELLFTRADIDGRFRPDDFERLHDESLLQTEAREDAENVFRTGALDFALYTFDEAVVVHFPDEDGALFVALSDSDVPLLPTIELCAEWVGTSA